MDTIASLQLCINNHLCWLEIMALVHISLRLPLVLWANSLVLDLIFYCTEIHWMSAYHRPVRSNMIRHGKWEESSGVLSLWFSHQRFGRRAVAEEPRGCPGHFHPTGSCPLPSPLHLALLKILLFLSDLISLFLVCVAQRNLKIAFYIFSFYRILYFYYKKSALRKTFKMPTN